MDMLNFTEPADLSSYFTEPDDDDYQPLHERPETYVVPVLFFIIFVVGVLGNGTLVVIFLKHRAMRNVPNTYIFSLALADLLVIISVVPFTSIIYTLPMWPWGSAMCKISEAVKNISIGVSVFTLTALSAERYCAIVNPLKKFQTKPLTVFSAIFIWFLAAVLSIPDAIFSAVETKGNVTFCIPFPEFLGTTYRRYNVVTKAVVYYLLPLTIIAIFYVLMAQRLHASARNMPGEIQGGQGVAQAKARKHVARMVLAFVFLFFVCFFPYHLYMLWFVLCPTAEMDYNEYWHAIKIIAFCMTFLNSCVNPVALYCVSGVFRQHYNRYLGCGSGRRLKRNMPIGNCETSFNSTYRRHTQASTLDTQSIYRKNASMIHRKNNLTPSNNIITTTNINNTNNTLSAIPQHTSPSATPITIVTDPDQDNVLQHQTILRSSDASKDQHHNCVGSGDRVSFAS